MNNDLDKIKNALPNLYVSLDRNFNLKSLDTVKSLEECKKLCAKFNKFSNSFLQFHRLDDGWYKDLAKDFGTKKNYGNIVRSYFEIKAPELGFTKNLSLASSKSIKEYIKREMDWFKINNKGLYDYYLAELFDGAESMDSYFAKFEEGVPASQLDAIYQDLYRHIQEAVQPARDLLLNISSYIYDEKKNNIYFESIKKATSINLNGKNADFTRRLVSVIKNFNSYSVQFSFTKALLDAGINPVDGSIKRETRADIKSRILKELSITVDLPDDEFGFLESLLDLNINLQVRNLLLADYVNLINKYFSMGPNKYRSLFEYQRIGFELLRYQALAGQWLRWYPEELEVLNNLESLRCYSILNEFLLLKFKNSGKNLAKTGIKDSVRNSIEYNVLIKGNQANIANSLHMNVYYTVFNRRNHLPMDSDVLILLMESDMKLLKSNDRALYREIRDKFLNGSDKIVIPESFKYVIEHNRVNYLKGIYNQIYEYLGRCRNNGIVDAVEPLIYH